MTTYEKKLRRTEEELRKNKTLLEEIEQLTDAGGWEYDVATKHITWTMGVYRIHGVIPGNYDPNQLEKSLEFYPPYDRKIIKEAFEKAIKLGIPYDLELSFIKATGEHIWVRTKVRPEIKDGKTVRLIGYIMDITELKGAEAEAKAARELMETAINRLPAAINIIRGRDLRLVLVNDGYRALAPGKVMLGQTLAEIWPETRQDFTAICRRVLETGEPHIVEDELNMIRRTPDGPVEARYFSWSLHRIRLPGDEGWGLLNPAWETTAGKQAEEALTAAHQQLQSVIDNTPSMVYACDLEARFVMANVALAALLKTTPELMIGKRRHEFMPQADADAHEANDRDVIATGRAVEFEEHSDLQGRSITWLSTKFPLRNTEGQVYAVAGIVTDITERKRLEDELKKAYDDLERRVQERTTELRNQQKSLQKLNEKLLKSNKELESFAYITSHDLQEPLRMVTSYSQLLAMKYKDQLDKNANDYINFAVDGAKHMHNLINGLLQYSRISRKEAIFSDVDLNEILQTVKSNLAYVIKERDIKISTGKMPVISADRIQMIQLFQNLISNGIKFSKSEPTIMISSKLENNHYVFSVRDNGIGIETQYFDKIFEIFKRLNLRDQFEGTGIGLAICKRIVENHNGTIWVESKPGKGSVFHFTIPTKKTEDI